MSVGIMSAAPPDVREWGLSQRSMAVLRQEPEITADLAKERKKKPFPAGYQPKIIEILYDDLVYVRSERGRITYLRDCPRNYIPPFMEIRFDDQLAMFAIQGEMVVNRTEQMAALDELLGRLDTDTK